MSLEQALAANTAALIDHAAVMRQYLTSVNSDAAAPAVSEPKKSAKVSKPTVVEDTPEVAPEVVEEPELKPAATAEQIPYEVVAKAITSLGASKGREAAVALLGKFSLKKLTEATPDQYADILAAAQAA